MSSSSFLQYEEHISIFILIFLEYLYFLSRKSYYRFGFSIAFELSVYFIKPFLKMSIVIIPPGRCRQFEPVDDLVACSLYHLLILGNGLYGRITFLPELQHFARRFIGKPGCLSQRYEPSFLQEALPLGKFLFKTHDKDRTF